MENDTEERSVLSYMVRKMNQSEIEKAIQNATPQKPIKHELGGDYYYSCHWIKCGETLHKWWKYCPNCGNKIDWSDEYIDDFEKFFYENCEV